MGFFTYNFDIALKDVDKTNKITNQTLLSFMEDIACMHSEHTGYGINQIDTTHLSWILLGWKLKVLFRPSYGTKLKIITWGNKFTKSYAIRDFKIYDEKDNLVAIAKSKWVLVNTISNRLTRITTEIISSYGIEEESVFPETDIDFKPMEEPQNCLNTFFYTVLRNNIDINNHMHNLYYLDLAYETLPDDIYENYNFKNIEIIYKKGCTLYNKIQCKYYFENNIHYVYIKSLDDSILHAVIKFEV